MSRKGRERRRAASGPAPSTEAISAPPDDNELLTWPAFWRELAERLHPAWARAPDPAAPTVRFVSEQRHWAWGNSTVQFAATLLDDDIRWQQEWPEEDGIDQPIADFLAFGAPPGGAPALVESDLREVIRARDPSLWRGRLDAAASLRRRCNGHFDGTLAARAAVASDLEYRRSGDFVWEWGEEADGYVAILSRDSISWNWHGPKDFGNSIEQPVVDFIAAGPDEKNAPDGLAWEMFNAIRMRDPARWPRLLAETRAPHRNRAPGDDDKPSGRGGRKPNNDSWEWGDKHNRYGAFLTDDGVYWWWEGEKDQGGGSEQSSTEFIADGPLDKDAPEKVVRSIRDAIAARATNEPLPPAQARSAWAPVRSRERPIADDDPAEPLGRLLLQGLAVIGGSVLIALLLASVEQTLGKYVGILLPVLLGFAATFRWGSLTLIVAGFFGVAAGVGSQFTYERYSELARGGAATLETIAEAPDHPEATRFVVADARVARAFAGHHQRTAIRQYGAGPREQVVSYDVMPLVPRGWTRTQPVPAWIVCGSSPGFDCLRAVEGAAGRTIRVRDEELRHFRSAIANAERRHGIASAANAPVLEASDDPLNAPGFYLAATVMIPLAVFGLWSVTVAIWRIWRRRRPPAITPST